MYRIWNIYVLAALGTIGGMIFGFEISSMSAWIGSDQYREFFNDPDSVQQGGITASMPAGSFVGAIAAGAIADWLGRAGSLKVASVIWIIGSILQCSAQNMPHLIVGRVVSGLSIGITSSQCIVYLAELSPARIRGRVVGIQQWAIEWGILIMYLISYACAMRVSGPASFRIAWGLQAVPGAVLFVSLWFFPESPRWLAQKDRWDEAHHVLAHLHGKGDRQAVVVLAELEEVREAARLAAETSNIGYGALFTKQQFWRTVTGISVQVWQQLLGGNIMLYYLVYIFNMAGIIQDAALTSSIIQYVIFLVTTGGLLLFIDKVGRRWLLIIGALICSVLHFTAGAVMAVHGYEVDSVDGNAILTWEVTGRPATAIIALMYIFVGVYGLTWAPIGWIYAGEVFPLRLRAKGVGLAAAGNWAFNLALAFFVPPAFTNIQWRTYIIFGVFCIVMTVHVFLCYPETAQKSLEEIDELFHGGIPAWKTGHGVRTFEQRVHAIKETGDFKEGALHGAHAEDPGDIEKGAPGMGTGRASVDKPEVSHDPERGSVERRDV